MISLMPRALQVNVCNLPGHQYGVGYGRGYSLSQGPEYSLGFGYTPYVPINLGQTSDDEKLETSTYSGYYGYGK